MPAGADVLVAVAVDVAVAVAVAVKVVGFVCLQLGQGFAQGLKST